MAPSHQTVSQSLAEFEPVSLAQAAGAALLRRVEFKYVFAQSLLAPLLTDLAAYYRVLWVKGQVLNRYRTLYYDTPDLVMYRRHHAGAASRYKVRAREYVESGAAFLEVKHKTGGRRTEKARIVTRELLTRLTPQAADFLASACPYAPDALAPCLWNQFTRITLVSKHGAERVTLDLNLTYLKDSAWAVLPDIVVAEVKCEGARSSSPFAGAMHRCHIRETGFSKYCMGVSLIYPGVKHNNFKSKQRLIARLQRGTNNDRF